jgi:hypothetical protein
LAFRGFSPPSSCPDGGRQPTGSEHLTACATREVAYALSEGERPIRGRTYSMWLLDGTLQVLGTCAAAQFVFKGYVTRGEVDDIGFCF